MLWYVYILFCDQKSYYVGITHDLEQRLRSHRNKENIGTKEFNEIHMVYSETHKERIYAEKREKQLKKWSVAKKKALIEENFDLLKKLSKNHETVDG